MEAVGARLSANGKELVQLCVGKLKFTLETWFMTRGGRDPGTFGHTNSSIIKKRVFVLCWMICFLRRT